MIGKLLLLLLMLPGHHGDAGRYEESLTLLNGKVVEVQFINPHSIIVFDVTNESGKAVRWRGELGAPNTLSREFGWTKSTLKAGDKIILIGRRLKNGSPYLNLTETAKIVMTEGGKEIFRTPNALPGLTTTLPK